MNSETIIALRVLLNNKNYNEFFKLVEKEITEEFVDKVKSIDPNYNYSTLPELVEKVEQTLPEKYIYLANRFYMLTKDQSDINGIAQNYLEIYKEL